VGFRQDKETVAKHCFTPEEAGAGWKVGVDGSVAIVTLGGGGSIDTDKITDPIIGFILDPKGLMLNLTLEGSKISRISPE
jgi:lipid-binding SYLF domain-containing protein